MPIVHSMPMVEISRQIALSGLTREAVALEAGVHPSDMSRILRGLRTPPSAFSERVIAALNRLIAAEEAASQARERVLAEGRSA